MKRINLSDLLTARTLEVALCLLGGAKVSEVQNMIAEIAEAFDALVYLEGGTPV